MPLCFGQVCRPALQGRIQGGGGRRTRRAPPLKLEKNMIFLRKIVIFHTKYLNNFRASLGNWKTWFFGVKSWFFTRNTPNIFAPPSARRNFFKCAPLTWNPGSAPALQTWCCLSCLLSTYTFLPNGSLCQSWYPGLSMTNLTWEPVWSYGLVSNYWLSKWSFWVWEAVQE